MYFKNTIPLGAVNQKFKTGLLILYVRPSMIIVQPLSKQLYVHVS